MALRKPLFRKFEISPVVPTEGDSLVLAKPLTYMNRCGEVLPVLMRKTKASPAEILVVVDTLDLSPGSIRLKRKGAHGGHNGLRSISTVLGTDEYSRLYIGIGRPREKSMVVDYVLSGPAESDRRTYDGMFDRAADAVVSVAVRGVDRVMNEVNRRNAD